MRVIISPFVHEVIDEFYDYALMHHEAYDEISAIKKKDRLYNAMYSLGRYARIHPKARLKKEWIENDYYEFISEDFHFAYYVAEDEGGDDIVIIADACHSLLYH